MRQVFDCLNCGHISDLHAPPMRCDKCGRGNGIVRELQEHERQPKPPEEHNKTQH